MTKDAKSFLEVLERLSEKDKRYKLDAYTFVLASLDRSLGKLDKPRHISARELLTGVKEYAQKEYGPMAAAVFAHWGIKEVMDIGHIVFNLINAGLLGKSEEDSLEDFNNAEILRELFDSGSAIDKT
jgi:uncharacterized repeat protein (TIGR04138 family)